MENNQIIIIILKKRVGMVLLDLKTGFAEIRVQWSTFFDLQTKNKINYEIIIIIKIKIIKLIIILKNASTFFT